MKRLPATTPRQPCDISPVIQAAHDVATDPSSALTGALWLPSGYEQFDFLLVKPSAP